MSLLDNTRETTTLAHRNKTRQIALQVAAAGHDAMRRNIHVIRAAQYFNQFHKLDFFEPYEYQLKWFRSGSRCSLRYLSAANRIGKTYCAAAEFAYHATGCYPAWWRGYLTPMNRIGNDRVMWAVGASTEATRKVLQKELLGTDDARRKDLIGSGSIPRELINFDSFVCDGVSVKSFRVFHASGEETTIHFYSAMQDHTVLMGQAIIYGWIDEQSEKEDELVGQCTTRTTTTKGVTAITATPEVGATPLYERCKDDKTGEVFFQNATWDDAPHITKEDKDRMLAITPYFQREMRSKGIPIVGVGLIYPFPDEQVICADFSIPDHWLVLAACDFGVSGMSDPSVIVFIAMDPESGKKYLFREWDSATDRDEMPYANSHLSDYMARKIIGEPPLDWERETQKPPSAFSGMGLPSIPFKVPPDGQNIEQGTQQTRADLIRSKGVDVCPELFNIPRDLLPMETNRRSLVGSIALVAQWFQDDELRIFSSCTNTIAEWRLYQWKKKGGRTIPADARNHHMDAMRYGFIRVRDDGIPMRDAKQPAGSAGIEIDNPYEYDMGAFKL